MLALDLESAPRLVLARIKMPRQAAYLVLSGEREAPPSRQSHPDPMSRT